MITGEEAGKNSPNAYADAVGLLKEHAKVKGDVHFFAGTIEEAQAFFDIGFTLSFTGVITFAREYEKIIKHVPLDMIMSETDAPYAYPSALPRPEE